MEESECQEEVTTSGNANGGPAILDVSEAEMLRLEAICRLCANHSEKIIGIYSEEGISNGLPIKLNLYLPIKVAEGDSLPLQCCWSCASTVLAWHELVVTTVEADRRLRELQIVSGDQLQNNEEDAKISLSPEHEKSILDGDTAHEDEIAQEIERGDGQCMKQNNSSKHSDGQGRVKTSHKMRGRGYKRRNQTDIEHNIFCDVCNRGFTRRFDLEKHRKSKHSDNMCEEAKFKKQSELESHGGLKLRRKQGDEDIASEYFCDVCNNGFKRKHDMVKHRKKQHPDQAPLPSNHKKAERANFLQAAKITGPDEGTTFYKCRICERVFKESSNLVRHQTVHTGVRAFFCHICGKNYSASNGLKRHINEHHYGVKKYACDVCGKRFTASATRDQHLNIHTDTRPFVCDVCGKAFKQRSALFTHKLFHKNDFKFSCEVCDRRFRRNTELTVHSWVHTGHKPHKCELCSASFRLKKGLSKHLRLHNEQQQKKWVCTECGMVFNQQKDLNDHKKTHQCIITIVPPSPANFVTVKSEVSD